MARPRTEAADYKRIALRLPVALLEALQDQASQTRRTLNTHLLCVLEYGAGLTSEHPLPKEKRLRKPKNIE